VARLCTATASLSDPLNTRRTNVRKHFITTSIAAAVVASHVLTASASPPPSDEDFLLQIIPFVDRIGAATLLADEAIMALENYNTDEAARLARLVSSEWDSILFDAAALEDSASVYGRLTTSVFSMCAAAWNASAFALEDLDPDALTLAGEAIGLCGEGSTMLGSAIG
jgi:hypothetical protein